MEHFDAVGIESMLRELRPTPSPEFVTALDARAGDGFSWEGHRRGGPGAHLVDWLRSSLSPRQVLGPATAGAVVVIAVTTAIVATSHTGSEVAPPPSTAPALSLRGKTSAPSSSTAAPTAASAVGEVRRDVERSAQVTLLTDPENVADDSAEVFAAVHAAHGIVLSSNTTQGPAGRAGARFELLVPSARLGDALAAISAIDEVGSRHDATADITAQTVATDRRLRDARESIESLVSQLAAAETDAEREFLEGELRRERRSAAALQAQLAHLHERTHYSHLSVRIETGHSPDPSGAWGVDDALHDAGHILAIAAGVTLVGLAVLSPLAILVLLVWLTHRTWLRIRRNQALSGG